GGIQAASPLAFWWLGTATVYALSLVLIASVCIGFAVADGRWVVIAVETNVAAIFVVIAAAAVTQSPWLLVLGLVGHGLKDLWQHRSHFVANTRWWPPSASSSTGSPPRSLPSRSWRVFSSTISGTGLPRILEAHECFGAAPLRLVAARDSLEPPVPARLKRKPR